MVASINAYETKDGTMFRIKSDAEAYENKEEIRKFVYSHVDHRCYNGMRKDDVSNYIITKFIPEWEEFKKQFKGGKNELG